MNIFSKGTLSVFDWLLISGVVFFNILHSTLVNELDLIGSLASVTGVVLERKDRHFNGVVKLLGGNCSVLPVNKVE